MGVSVALLAVFLATVDVGRMLDALADANYLFVAPGVALYLGAVWVRTLRWQVLMRHMRPVSVVRLFPVVVVGYMANNLLPMRIGELVRSYYVGEREGVSKTSALATILIERVLDAVVLLLFVAVIALFLPVAGLAEAFGDKYGVPWPLLVLALSVPFFGLFAVLVLLALFPARPLLFVLLLLRPLPERIESPMRHLVHMFLDGLVSLRSARRIAFLMLLTVPIWLLEAGLFFLVGYSFGLEDIYESAGQMALALVLVTAVANIGSSVPAAPGGVGLFELVARETLVLLPLAVVDRAVAAGYATVVHAALLLPMILLGQLFLWTENASLGNLWRGGRSVARPGVMGAEGSAVSGGERE